MANTISNNLTSVDTANAVGNWVVAVAGGGASLAQDTDIKIEGTASLAEQISTTRRGALYNYTTTQDMTGDTYYLWVNCGIVGLLDVQSNGGFTVRFAGPTVTDYFEVYVGGSDSWPVSIAGGWTQFVVDVTLARSTAITNGWTGGTAPALTAVQHVGYTAITAAVMTKAADNTWIDWLQVLPSGSPGIIVEGRNGGSTDWNWADVYTQLGVTVGTFKPTTGGAYAINTPIQFGINDTTTHGFADTDAIILWEDQEYADPGLYGLQALGNSGGTTNVQLGAKTGTGDDATGAQGGVISAASTGVRWYMDFNDPDLDAINFYGAQFIHGSDFLLDDAAVEVISCIYLDCSSALVSNSSQLRNSIIDANTADDVAFMTTDDFGDLVFCTFQFSDGHGVELTTPRIATQTSKGNRFIGYGTTTSTDAAVYNNTAGLVDISATVGASVSEHTYKDGTSASTTVTAAITVSYSNFAVGTEIRVYIVSSGLEEDGIETTVADPWDATLQSGIAYNIVAIYPGYVPIRFENQTYTGDATVNLNQQVDRNFENN